MKMVERLFPRHFDSIRIVEWVIAFYALVGGLLVYSPLYRLGTHDAPGVIAALFNHPGASYAFAGLMVLAALCIMYGLVRQVPWIRSIGLFYLILLRTFQIVSVLVVEGGLPFIGWLYPLTLMTITLVLWINVRLEVKGDGVRT